MGSRARSFATAITFALAGIGAMAAVGGASDPEVAGAQHTASASGAPASPVLTVAGAAEPQEVAAAAAVIAGAELARTETIDAVDAVRFTDAGVEAAADALAVGATGDALWAATWIYASGASDPAPLLPLLTAGDPSVRAMAASGLLARGVRDAAAPLVALVGSEEPLRGSDPPLLVGDYAAASLTRFVSGPTVAAGAARADAAASWSAWLTENESIMIYDDDTGRWSAP